MMVMMLMMMLGVRQIVDDGRHSAKQRSVATNQRHSSCKGNSVNALHVLKLYLCAGLGSITRCKRVLFVPHFSFDVAACILAAIGSSVCLY